MKTNLDEEEADSVRFQGSCQLRVLDFRIYLRQA